MARQRKNKVGKNEMKLMRVSESKIERKKSQPECKGRRNTDST